MPDYTSDVATIIGNWDTRIVIKRDTLTFNDRGESRHNWNTISEADMDIQPVDEKVQAYMTEIGIKEIFTHIVFGYYDTTDARLDIVIGDILCDSDTKLYKIRNLREYEDSHCELYCTYIEGSGERIGFLELEEGDFVLLEDGDRIWIE